MNGVDQFFAAYGKWPPTNQVLFAAVALGVGLVAFIIALTGVYYLVHYVVVLFRGWPVKHDPRRPTWEEVRELANYMAAYRKWDKEQKAKDCPRPKDPPPKPACPPCGERRPSALFEKGAPE